MSFRIDRIKVNRGGPLEHDFDMKPGDLEPGLRPERDGQDIRRRVADQISVQAGREGAFRYRPQTGMGCRWQGSRLGPGD